MHAAFLVAILVLLGFCFQGSRPLWEPDEGRFVNIALQMLDSGDWWVPRFNDEQIHLAKPPMTYWLLAASMTVFGRNEWAARVPHAIAFVLTALLVADIARGLASARPRLAALVWATSVAPLAGAFVVTTDAILVLFQAAAMCAMVRAGVPQAENIDRRWIRLCWLAFALAFLTKGPPGLLPLLAIVVWLAWQRRWQTLGGLFDAVGVAVFLGVGLGWYVAIAARVPGAAGYFLGYEFVDRIFTGVHGRNAAWYGALSVYVPTLVLGLLPWWPFTLRRPEAAGESSPALPRSSRGFLWSWFAVPMVCFALARSRLPLYVLPLFIPLTVLVTDRIGVPQRSPRTLALFATAWIVAVVIAKGLLADLSSERDAKELTQEFAAAAARLSGPLSEIVFVDAAPEFGLRLYTAAPVKELSLAGASDSERRVLCREIDAAGSALWLVPEKVAGP
ncbi:MAG TPA: glycosyltransferase family 39 protein, partial [Povalibacter sp.]|nr:glycosyltransferase family 39 protein [Povalibacter sp.]